MVANLAHQTITVRQTVTGITTRSAAPPSTITFSVVNTLIIDPSVTVTTVTAFATVTSTLT